MMYYSHIAKLSQHKISRYTGSYGDQCPSIFFEGGGERGYLTINLMHQTSYLLHKKKDSCDWVGC